MTMQRGGYSQPDQPANPTPPSQRAPTARDVAQAIDAMVESLVGIHITARAAMESIDKRNAQNADPLDRERAKVAHLRGRVLGLLRALREAQDERDNALRIGAQYREAAERLVGRIEAAEVRIARLEAGDAAAPRGTR